MKRQLPPDDFGSANDPDFWPGDLLDDCADGRHIHVYDDPPASAEAVAELKVLLQKHRQCRTTFGKKAE